VFSFINNLGPKNVFWKNEKIIGSNYGKMVGMASIHIDLHKTAISRHSKKAYAKVSSLLQTSQKMVENVSLSHVSSSLSLPTEITRSREAGRLQFNDHILVEY
jgi:ABC-type phosphate transport system auxiliary subunit